MKKIILFPIYVFKYIQRIVFTSIVKFTVRSYGKKIKVYGFTKLSPNTVLENNCNFNGMRTQGKGLIKIGSNFHSGKNCRIITDVHNYDNGTKIPYDDTYIVKNVTIEANVWLGNDVLILGGITIGEGAIIQAGSVVVNDVLPCTIVGGNPAKQFKTRNIEHYNKLKDEGRFH